MAFSLNLHQTRSFRIIIIIYIYIIIYTAALRRNSILNYSSRTPHTFWAPCVRDGTVVFWGGGGGWEAWADDESEGGGGGLINRFYCRFTQYRMEDPIMLDTSCINHRCSGVYIYIHMEPPGARAPGIRKFMRTFEKRSETV